MNYDTMTILYSSLTVPYLNYLFIFIYITEKKIFVESRIINLIDLVKSEHNKLYLK